MAFKPCRRCRQRVSTDAKICPNCGKHNPTRYRLGCFSVLAIFATEILVIAFIQMRIRPPAPPPRAAVGATLAPWTAPPAGTKVLFRDLLATRQNAATVFSGRSLAPPGMQITFSVKQADGTMWGESTFTIDGSGHFSSIPYGGYEILVPAGTATLNFSTGSIDIPSVVPATEQARQLALKLPLSATVPLDPEFPSANRMIDQEETVAVPPLAPADAAIAAVQQATLYVRGEGVSPSPVGKVVDFFADPASDAGVVVSGWSARKSADGKWIITLDTTDGGRPVTPQWSWNPKSGDVRYLDPESKIFSFDPRPQ